MLVERLTAFLQSLKQLSRSFWVANLSELFERVAYYGTTSVLVLYLTQMRGLGEAEAQRLNGTFGLLVYGLPVLSGFLADLMGYRRALMVAYALLASGYLLVGQLTSYWTIAAALLLVAFGASLIKPTITGTVQKTCNDQQRAVGFSIYYMLVNIGGWLGPNISTRVGESKGQDTAFYFSTASTVLALLLVAVMFRDPAPVAEGERKSFGAFIKDFGRVVGNARLMALFLCAGGFWCLFFLLYGPLPGYVVKDLKESQGTFGTLVSLDAAAVVLFQVVVGYLTRSFQPARAVLLGVVLATVGIGMMGLYPSVYMVAAGILVLACGEMVYSAHFYKYLGDMAPPDQVGMYMGFAFLPIALGNFASGFIGGAVSPYFRDTVGQPQLMWFAFASVGVLAAVGLALLTRFARKKEA